MNFVCQVPEPYTFTPDCGMIQGPSSPLVQHQSESIQTTRLNPGEAASKKRAAMVLVKLWLPLAFVIPRGSVAFTRPYAQRIVP